jgi:hypothetical protein
MISLIGGRIKAMDIKRELFNKLNSFHHDKDFVVGVMSNAKHDEDRETILQFMEAGEDVTVENIILLSLHLSNERKAK